jgi:hypothetical protein
LRRHSLFACFGSSSFKRRIDENTCRAAHGPNGRPFEGDEKDNKAYSGCGNEVLAVADGVVAATKDGIPENIPGLTSRAVPIHA